MKKSYVNTLKAWIYSQPTLKNVPNYNGQPVDAKRIFKGNNEDLEKEKV